MHYATGPDRAIVGAADVQRQTEHLAVGKRDSIDPGRLMVIPSDCRRRR